MNEVLEKSLCEWRECIMTVYVAVLKSQYQLLFPSLEDIINDY